MDGIYQEHQRYGYERAVNELKEKINSAMRKMYDAGHNPAEIATFFDASKEEVLESIGKLEAHPKCTSTNWPSESGFLRK